MTTARALLLLPLAGVMLALAALETPIEASLQALGMGEEAARIAPLVATGLATAAFLVFVVVWFVMVGNYNRAERLGPYIEALRPFAAEFGRGVTETRDGLELHLQRDGQKVQVRLDTRSGGRLTILSPPAARQALAWLSAGAEAPRAKGWREVERGGAWQMHAELPAMARPLLADGQLMDVVGRYFALPEAASVTHTLAGIAIDGTVPTADRVDAQVRLAVEIAFRLRRVNG